MNGFWRAEAAALLVRVKVQPKSRRPGLEGLRPAQDGPRLRVLVAEAPAARAKTLRVLGDVALLIPKLEALA
jgi:uncharacterized protein YggU (UPF0235/DUF167 family)